MCQSKLPHARKSVTTAELTSLSWLTIQHSVVEPSWLTVTLCSRSRMEPWLIKIEATYRS